MKENTNTFIRKSFYIDPPKNASEIEWHAWLKADDKKAAVDKMQHTKSLEHGNIGDLPHFSTGTIKGGDGVHRQAAMAIGFAGDFENGNGQITPIQKATQELSKRTRGNRSSIERRSKKSKKQAKSKRIFH